jgi:glycosyltransferase involved in cell wall biosynthesis
LQEIEHEHILLIADIVMIDNCSSDESVDLLSQMKKIEGLEIFQNTSNIGLGGSQKTIFNLAKSREYEYVCILHSDLQPTVKDLMLSIETIRTKGFDAVLGSRFKPGSIRINYSKIRFLGNIILLSIFTFRFRRVIYDLGSGLNCYRTSKLPRFSDLPNDLSYNCNLLVRQIKNRNSIYWQPITWREGAAPSSLKPFKLFTQSILATLNVFTRGELVEKPRPL